VQNDENTSVAIKRVLQNIGVLLLAHALVKPAWVLAEVWVQNQMGHAQYGGFSAMFQLAFVLSPVLDMGTAMLLTRYYAKQLGEDGRAHALQTYTQNVTKLRTLLAVAYIVLVLVAGLVLGYAANNTWLACLVLLSGYNVAIGALLFMRAQLQGQLRFRAEAFAGVADRLLLMLALVVITAAAFTIGPLAFALLLLGTAVAAIVLVGEIGGVRKVPLAFTVSFASLTQLKPYLLAGLPLTLVLLISALNERLPELLIERLEGAEANSLFAAAHRWYKAADMYLWTVMPVFYARFAAAHLPENDSEKLLRYGTRIAALPVAAFGAVMAWWPEVFTLLLRNSTPAELSIVHTHLRWLAVPLTLHALVVVYGTHLTASGHLRALIWVQICAVVAQAATSAILLPTYGAQAAPIGVCVTIGVVAIGYLYFHHRFIPRNVQWRVLLRLLLAVGAMHATVALLLLLPITVGIALAAGGLVLLVAGVPMTDWRKGYALLIGTQEKR